MAIHNFTTGEVVYVLNQSGSGNFFLEGKAKILRAIPNMEDRYIVRFVASDGTLAKQRHERYVDPNAQTDPQAFVNTLNRNHGKSD